MSEDWIETAVTAGVISAEEGEKIRGYDPVNFAMARELLQTKAIAALAVLAKENRQ